MLRRCSAAIIQRALPSPAAAVLVAVRPFTASAASAAPASVSPARAPRVRRPYIAFKPQPKPSAKQLNKMASAAAPSSSSAPPAVQLREILKRHNLAAYVVPTADAHQSEYVSDADKRRAFLTGFTGSAGTAVVLADPYSVPSLDAALFGPPDVCGRLFTDGRYFLQAVAELDPKHYALMKGGVTGVPKMEDWLLAVLPKGSRVAVDPSITSMSAYKSLKTAFKGAIDIVFLEKNLVDEVWGAARPSYSKNPLRVLADKYTGETSASKLDRIRKKMAEQRAELLVVAALDEVAWLFNLRGADIPFNPVFRSYAVVAQDSVTLYVDQDKITDEIREHLKPANVRLAPYDAIWNELKTHASSSGLSADKRIWLDPARVSSAVQACFPNAEVIFEADNPIQLMKAIKNATEVAGMRRAHQKDAAAVINFLSWLEIELLENKNESLTECSVSDKLEAFRAEQPDFVGLSFETIAGSGSNGAIIHYKPEPESCKAVTAREMFLLDSGAQFLDGTTDITRTVKIFSPSVGTPPTDFETLAFTKVLQGHIQLAAVVFPTGTVGPTIDVLARQKLWESGMDYVHGTGHGVGAFLNVHEGPAGISSSGRSHSALATPLAAGMILSNEPGYYEDGKFGVRIESLIVVQAVETAYKFQNKQFLGFDTITLVPLQRTLMQMELLTPKEREWIDQYHRTCREQIAPLLQGRAKEWLIRETEPLPKA